MQHLFGRLQLETAIGGDPVQRIDQPAIRVQRLEKAIRHDPVSGVGKQDIELRRHMPVERQGMVFDPADRIVLLGRAVPGIGQGWQGTMPPVHVDERIFLGLLFNIALQIRVGQLQQGDRLLHDAGHDQRLSLALTVYKLHIH